MHLLKQKWCSESVSARNKGRQGHILICLSILIEYRTLYWLVKKSQSLMPSTVLTIFFLLFTDTAFNMQWVENIFKGAFYRIRFLWKYVVSMYCPGLPWYIFGRQGSQRQWWPFRWHGAAATTVFYFSKSSQRSSLDWLASCGYPAVNWTVWQLYYGA